MQLSGRIFFVILSGIYAILLNNNGSFYESSKDTMKSVLPVVTSDTLQIQFLLNRSDFYTKSNLTLAQQYCDSALAISQKVGTYRQLFASLQMAGKISYDVGLIDKAVEYVIRYKDLSERKGNEYDMAMSYLDYGTCLTLFNDYEKAELYMLKALKFFKSNQHIVNDSIRASNLITLYKNLGVLYSNKGDTTKAIAFNLQGIKIGEENHVNSTPYIKLLNSQSYLLLLKKKRDESKRTIDLAIRLSKENNDIYSEGISYCLLGIYQNNTGNYRACYQAYIKSLQLAEVAKSLTLRSDAYEGLFNLFEKWGPSDSILKYHRLTEQSTKEQKIRKGSNSVVKYEVTNELDKKGNEVRVSLVNKIYGLILILLILLVVAFVLLKKYRNKADTSELENDLLDQKTRKAILENRQLEEKLELKNKQLTTEVLSQMKKNEAIEEVVQRLIQYSQKMDPKEWGQINRIMQDLGKVKEETVWKEFEIRYNQVHNDFFDKLRGINPNLTTNELRICAFLKLHMTTKEISSITGQTTHSIEIARYRLRKKLGLSSSSIGLIQFISAL